MDRRSLSLRWPVVVVSLALFSVVLVGCKSGLETATLLWNGYDIQPEFDGLKGKTVAVVCKPLTSQEFSNAGAARALTEGICECLKAHIKDIHLVDPQKVTALVDEKGMEDYVEIGKALKAEKVIGIDIESFGVLDGQTLFKGRASVSIRVYDVAEKQIEWHKAPPQFVYPKIGSTPVQELPEGEFRNQFVANLAEQIARYFYPHDRHDDYASDVSSTR
ncbi:MAG: hypothetical protein ABSG53_10435 [Thermoguttaceae bacterium]